jgi:hypothetical protein
VYTVFCTIFTFLHPIPTSSPFYWFSPPMKDMFCPSVLRFCKRKKKSHILLVQGSIQGLSLWNFHIHNSPTWVISLVFLLSTLFPFYGCFN